MSKKEKVLCGLGAILAGLYVVNFSGWFTPKTLEVEHSVRPTRGAGGDTGNVCFTLHKRYRIKSLRVVPVEQAKTNQHGRTLWHLVSRNGSEPADGFAYGFQLAGMTPALPGVKPDPLEPGVEYRLYIETADLKGEHDFSLPGGKAERAN